MSEAEIITRILSGEEQLFARIVQRYSGYVWALCSSYVRNPSDCEDVAQEVFVQCYRRLDTLRNPAAFGGWLSQLARRHCLMWLRSSARRERHLTEYGQGIETRTGELPMDNTARKDPNEGIWEEIDTLPPDYREALLLRFSEGYTVEEAASFLGITPAAMRKRLERAQGMLRDRLWDRVEPALAKRKHHEQLARGILAAVPFGQASWLGATGAGVAVSAATASKLTLMGGTTAMSKVMIIGIGAVIVLLGAAFGAHHMLRPSHVESQSAPAAKIDDAAQALPAAVTAPAPAEKPAPSSSPQATAAKTLLQAAEAPAVIPTTVLAPASVSGVVQDAVMRPIAGADVVLEIGRDRYCNDVVKTYAAKSGSDGTFQIAGIDTFGSAHVFGAADGYGMARVGLGDVLAGKKIKDADIMLWEERYYVAGRVVTENKAPVADASVDTLYFGYDEGGLAVTAATGVTTGNISDSKFTFAHTDKNGAFKLSIGNTGLCDLRVMKSGFGSGFFPQVQIGAEDIELVLHTGGSITGKITTAEGTPAPGTTVRVAGEALPGGLKPSPVKIQKLPIPPIVATTGADGVYTAEGLGEDYVYTVSVPASEPSDAKGSANDAVRVHIASAMRDLDGEMFGAEWVAARKTDIHVKAGQAATGVDLVLGTSAGATLHGVVTDRSSGKPVCPVVVTAGAADAAEAENKGNRPRLWFQTGSGGSAVTNADGSYTLRIQDPGKTRGYRIGYAFMTEGGCAWEQPDEEIALLQLGPGDNQEVNFTVDAPVTVPARYVDSSGAPIEGVNAAMRQPGGQGSCRGVLTSGADGRVTFHGVRPNVSLQVFAMKRVAQSFQTLCEGDPFTGQPGETVPEVTVVCRMFGGLDGALAYADGRPVANTAINAEGQRIDETANPIGGSIRTDANGAVQVPEIIPEGTYSLHVTFIDSQSGQAYRAAADSIAIVAGTTTNIGTLVAEPEKDPTNIAQASDWGRKASDAIAAVYTKEWAGTLSDPGLLLKTGFALYDVGRYPEALDAFVRMSQTTEGNDLYAAVALIWQGQMLDLMGKRQEAVAAYSAAANMNASDSIQHDQYKLAYSPTEYAQERMREPFTRIENTYP